MTPRCPRGHEYTPDNLVGCKRGRKPQASRQCLACARIRAAEKREAHRALFGPPGGGRTGRFAVRHGEAATRERECTSEYRAWAGMKHRCYYPSDPMYKHYGARGIIVCAKWLNDYPAFLADVGRRPSPKHSIDRIDNSRGYEPENVRWATPSEQQINRRNTRMVEFEGQPTSVTLLARRFGIGHYALRSRLDRGWPVERALSEPIHTYHRRKDAR